MPNIRISLAHVSFSNPSTKPATPAPVVRTLARANDLPYHIRWCVSQPRPALARFIPDNPPFSQAERKPIASSASAQSDVPQETLDFAHRMFDAARDNNSELLLQAVDVGLPPNLTNDKGALRGPTVATELYYCPLSISP